EKKDVKLVLGNEEGLKDDINYELCLVGKFLGEWVVHLDKSLGNVMWQFLDYDSSGRSTIAFLTALSSLIYRKGLLCMNEKRRSVLKIDGGCEGRHRKGGGI
ncbi:hypothetical protein Goarm_012032, partial [Gossypium armourianum]|nr:hypothetical protein [Gossypium armourianum]